MLAHVVAPYDLVSPAPGLDESRLTAWRALSSAHDVVLQRISNEMEQDDGLALDWYNVLLHLYETHGNSLPQSDLERRSALSQSGISRMVSKMEAAGLVSREPSEVDRRTLNVVITKHGKDTFLRATPRHHAAVFNHFGIWMTDQQAQSVASALGPVLDAALPDRASATSELDQLVSFGESVLSINSNVMLVRDAINTRDAVEPLLLSEAARNVTPQAINELRAIVTRMAGLIEYPVMFFQTDWELHRKLADFCRNEILQRLYLALLDVLSTNMNNVVPTDNLRNYLLERLAVHATLVEAVASRDEEQIAVAAHAHHFTSARAALIEGKNEGITGS